MRSIPYPHPGSILLHEFLEPMGIIQYRLAKSIGAPQRRIGEIVADTHAVMVDTDLRLARFFGTLEGLWAGLQLDYETARAKEVMVQVLDAISP